MVRKGQNSIFNAVSVWFSSYQVMSAAFFIGLVRLSRAWTTVRIIPKMTRDDSTGDRLTLFFLQARAFLIRDGFDFHPCRHRGSQAHRRHCMHGLCWVFAGLHLQILCCLVSFLGFGFLECLTKSRIESSCRLLALHGCLPVSLPCFSSGPGCNVCWRLCWGHVQPREVAFIEDHGFGAGLVGVRFVLR